VFVDRSSEIQSVSDSTLDCTVADLNNDGRYDIITAQGESGTFVNRFYRNTGPVDTMPPRVVGHLTPASGLNIGPVVVHAKVRDQVLDDGVNYVEGVASYVIDTAPSTGSISITSAAFVPPSLTVSAGTTIAWTNNSGASQSVASTTPPYTYESGSLAPGATYSYTFVTPGTYATTSAPGAFSGQVQVTGVAHSVVGTHSGGQMYRFGMTDTVSGQGIQLCYELRFTDWPGNVTVTESRCVPLLPPPPGAPFCPGDGTLSTLCPCSNFGSAGRGCANSEPGNQGALLESTGTVSPDTVVLSTSGERSSSLSIFMQGDVQNASGILFGDGLRCTAGHTKRLYVKSASGGIASAPVSGDPSITSRSATLGDPLLPGATRYYQTYYRDPDPSFCPSPVGAMFNVSSGQVITW
jgi:plastocyanin